MEGISVGEIVGYVLTFLGGGGLAAVVNSRINKKKASVEVKVDEIGALHKIIEEVYEPTIEFQKTRIQELEAEVKSVKGQLATEREERQRDMEMMNKRILEITSALGMRATRQIRDNKGRYSKVAEDNEA